jgi:hypothetical protein
MGHHAGRRGPPPACRGARLGGELGTTAIAITGLASGVDKSAQSAT